MMANNAGTKLSSLIHHPKGKGGIEGEGRRSGASAEGAKLELPRAAVEDRERIGGFEVQTEFGGVKQLSRGQLLVERVELGSAVQEEVKEDASARAGMQHPTHP